jgi:hypothetical protein
VVSVAIKLADRVGRLLLRRVPSPRLPLRRKNTERANPAALNSERLSHRLTSAPIIHAGDPRWYGWQAIARRRSLAHAPSLVPPHLSK